MTYQESIAYLEGLSRFGIRLGLERMQELVIRLGHPEKKISYYSYYRHERQRFYDGLLSGYFARSRVSYRYVYIAAFGALYRAHAH